MQLLKYVKSRWRGGLLLKQKLLLTKKVALIFCYQQKKTDAKHKQKWGVFLDNLLLTFSGAWNHLLNKKQVLYMLYTYAETKLFLPLILSRSLEYLLLVNLSFSKSTSYKSCFTCKVIQEGLPGSVLHRIIFQWILWFPLWNCFYLKPQVLELCCYVSCIFKQTFLCLLSWYLLCIQEEGTW